jgi:hypothetical protein
VNDFVESMMMSEKEHLFAFIKYVKGRGLDDELRNKQFDKFALRYNGPGYKQNQYDVKLEEAYKASLT